VSPSLFGVLFLCVIDRLIRFCFGCFSGYSVDFVLLVWQRVRCHLLLAPAILIDRNGTLDRGLDTKHAVFVTRGR
jgi:hypothetical protein